MVWQIASRSLSNIDKRSFSPGIPCTALNTIIICTSALAVSSARSSSPRQAENPSRINLRILLRRTALSFLEGTLKPTCRPTRSSLRVRYVHRRNPVSTRLPFSATRLKRSRPRRISLFFTRHLRCKQQRASARRLRSTSSGLLPGGGQAHDDRSLSPFAHGTRGCSSAFSCAAEMFSS